MFGFKFGDKEGWFTDRMETLSEHLSFKHSLDIGTDIYFYFFHANIFRFTEPQAILRFFLTNENSFFTYPDSGNNIYLTTEQAQEINSKINYQLDDNFTTEYLSFNCNQNYNIEIAKFIEHKLPYLFQSKEINIQSCSDAFCIVYDFNRGTLDFYEYNSYPIFVLEQDFYSGYYHPNLKFRLYFDDIYGESLILNEFIKHFIK